MKRIGIDIGGTTVKGALFEGDKIEREASAPTHGKEGREAILAALFAVADELHAGDAALIGVSSAGNIDPVSGVCVYATDNLRGWTGTPIKKILEERYQTACRVDNDAVCALKGELRFYPDLTDVTMLTFGTGVGGASLVGGNILRGRNFDAARWGHICLEAHGRKCNCGRRGCAERYLSATALFEQGRNFYRDLESCKQLFELYAAGEENAEKVLTTFGYYLNVLLDTIRSIVAPQLIILGGGVMTSRDVIQPLIMEQQDVAFARLGDKAGVYGAI